MSTPLPRPGAAAMTGIGVALPPAIDQQELWDQYFAGRPGSGRTARAAFLSAGVGSRHAVFDPRREDVSTWSTSRRMARYLDAALPLAEPAARTALARSGLDAGEVGLLVVVSCTGYAAPGLDVALAARLSLAGDARRLVVGHLGGHAALPALASAAEYVQARGRPALLVSTELSSLHLQPPPGGSSDWVVNALFADAAAAVVLTPKEHAAPAGRTRLPVLDHQAASDLTASSAMTWEIGDHGFVMHLSRRVPEMAGRLAEPAVDPLLARHGLGRDDVAWAIHPGGPRIVESVGRRLRLDPLQLEPSLAVLAERGNCSSATILLVLDELCRRGATGGAPVVLVAFGPGLTCYATLLGSPVR